MRNLPHPDQVPGGQRTLTVEATRMLTQVAEWLESGAPHRIPETGEVLYGFDMSTSSRSTGCGTVCCIAGAVVAFNPQEFHGNSTRVWPVMFRQVRDKLGLEHWEAKRLFEPSDMDNRTPAEGAEVIRRFIEDRSIIWK